MYVTACMSFVCVYFALGSEIAHVCAHFTINCGMSARKCLTHIMIWRIWNACWHFTALACRPELSLSYQLIDILSFAFFGLLFRSNGFQNRGRKNRNYPADWNRPNQFTDYNLIVIIVYWNVHLLKTVVFLDFYASHSKQYLGYSHLPKGQKITQHVTSNQ